ncbi:MAG TPA: hypothetical protein VMF05_09955 [Stellaceae bacterium]|nr:hypothetical protein [Stellaceae bacterium]
MTLTSLLVSPATGEATTDGLTPLEKPLSAATLLAAPSALLVEPVEP